MNDSDVCVLRCLVLHRRGMQSIAKAAPDLEAALQRAAGIAAQPDWNES